MILHNNYCLNCKKRDVCVFPCKEVERDLKDYHVAQREIPISCIISEDWQYNKMIDQASIPTSTSYDYWQYKEVSDTLKLTEKQSLILYLHMVDIGNNKSLIAKELGVSRQYIHKVLNNIADKIDNLV